MRRFGILVSGAFTGVPRSISTPAAHVANGGQPAFDRPPLARFKKAASEIGPERPTRPPAQIRLFPLAPGRPCKHSGSCRSPGSATWSRTGTATGGPTWGRIEGRCWGEGGGPESSSLPGLATICSGLYYFRRLDVIESPPPRGGHRPSCRLDQDFQGRPALAAMPRLNHFPRSTWVPVTQITMPR